MRKFLLGATALMFALTLSAHAGNFAGCTNVWVGGKLTKTGVCDLGHSKNASGKKHTTRIFKDGGVKRRTTTSSNEL